MSTMRTTAGHTLMTTHGIRGNYTLCGIAVDGYEWRSPFHGCDPVPQCKTCSAVQDGCGTSCDLLNFGLTYRQVIFWVRRGWLRPVDKHPGSGARLVFPLSEVKVAADMAVLVLAGVRPEAAYHAVRNGGQLAPGVRIVVDEAA